ncbi:hypothetical protein [Sanguibacter antarcticus]|uniref:Uncharacterized protein n=1 Tax=Sanguibacter antarcticus TaxID=372484 RepID=A0A2A9E9Z0_9MICO|nr:hypothetical protein [Sanguibacter antarcticus]PFG35019.1 hypothetical protein ATL42_2952 [Sanguibacter antarcticus]
MSTPSSTPLLSPMPATSAHPIADLYVRHLLGVSDDVDTSEVETLALARFPAARWEIAPAEEQTPEGVRLAPGVLRLSRHTLISGPYAPAVDDGTALDLDHTVSMVFDVLCPRERGPAPFRGGGDRDGLARIFAAGSPVREEWRVAQWLVAVGRRLGGSVRFEVADGEHTTVTPDPAVAVDMTIFSDVWLDPDAALSVCRTADRRSELAMTGVSWGGPPASTGAVPALVDSPLTPEQLRGLHERADAFDIAALTSPPPLSGYGVEVDLGKDGIVSVEISGVDQVPLTIKGLEWAKNGAVTYVVRWTPENLEDWQRERPSFDLKISRTRASGVVAGLTRALFQAVGGEVADQDEFLLDPDDV